MAGASADEERRKRKGLLPWEEEFRTPKAAVPGRADGLLTAADATKLAGLRVPVQRLAYVAASDLASGLAVAGGTWTDLVPSQGFTVGSATALLLVSVRLSCGVVNSAVGLAGFGARLLYDGTTPAKLAGAAAVASGYTALVGGTTLLTALAAGAHTVKVQINGSQAFTAYCRALTAPNQEWAEITIYEISA